MEVVVEVIQYNSHPIDMVTGDIDPSTNVNLVEIGTAVYPSLAMVCNHSCDPSTIRLSRGRELRMFARQAEHCETKVEWLRTTFGIIIPTHILPSNVSTELDNIYSCRQEADCCRGGGQ